VRTLSAAAGGGEQMYIIINKLYHFVSKLLYTTLTKWKGIPNGDCPLYRPHYEERGRGSIFFAASTRFTSLKLSAKWRR
jgi:hypothetical protein